MLEKIYVNNFRCLVNFELNFQNLTLLLGPNGSGKSTVFDVLQKIRDLIINNSKVSELFSLDDLTVWVNSDKQSFELTVKGNGGTYSYVLVVEHNKELNKQRIIDEKLLYDGKPLFERKSQDIQLFNDSHEKGPHFGFDWSLSGLSFITERPDNTKLIWFKTWVENLLILSLNPKTVTSISEEEAPKLNSKGTNFASWYRYISQEHQNIIIRLFQHLTEYVPGFDSFKLEMAGKHRILRVGIKGDKDKAKPVFFDFEALSDGQKALLILHTILLSLQELGYTLLIDEPENYIALVEIQPWLMELNDACDEGGHQAVLISHHPELIDYFGVENGKWIDRGVLEAARVLEMPKNVDYSLKLSEQIARGWTEWHKEE